MQTWIHTTLKYGTYCVSANVLMCRLSIVIRETSNFGFLFWNVLFYKCLVCTSDQFHVKREKNKHFLNTDQSASSKVKSSDNSGSTSTSSGHFSNTMKFSEWLFSRSSDAVIIPSSSESSALNIISSSSSVKFKSFFILDKDFRVILTSVSSTLLLSSAVISSNNFVASSSTELCDLTLILFLNGSLATECMFEVAEKHLGEIIPFKVHFFTVCFSNGIGVCHCKTFHSKLRSLH